MEMLDNMLWESLDSLPTAWPPCSSAQKPGVGEDVTCRPDLADFLDGAAYLNKKEVVIDFATKTNKLADVGEDLDFHGDYRNFHCSSFQGGSIVRFRHMGRCYNTDRH